MFLNGCSGIIHICYKKTFSFAHIKNFKSININISYFSFYRVRKIRELESVLNSRCLLVGGGFWGGNGFGDWRGFDGKACGSYFQLSKRNSFSRGLLKQYF